MARIEATPKGLDVRYVVTSLKAGARHLYETIYCARGNAENFIKLHKSQLASDRTSCRDPKANQFRLILHTAAYWLMLAHAQCRSQALPGIRLRSSPRSASASDQDRGARGGVRGPHPRPSAHQRCSRSRDVFRALAGRFCAAGPFRRCGAVAAIRALRRNIQPKFEPPGAASSSRDAIDAPRALAKSTPRALALLRYFG